MTTEDAALYLLNNPKGAVCPCCNRFTKTYKRKLNSGMALSLITLYKRFGRNPVRINKELSRGGMGLAGEYAKLRYWGLLEKTEDTGRWRVTETGEAFVLNQISVPKHVLLRNRKFLGLTGVLITVETALGDKFSYRELMSM